MSQKNGGGAGSDIMSAVTAVLFASAFGVSFALSAGLPMLTGFIFAGIILLIGGTKKELRANVYACLPCLFIISEYGIYYGALSVLLSAVLFLLFRRFKGKLGSIPTDAAMFLGLSFAITAMFTNKYFDIGCNASTVWQMLRQYRYLGFHGNWLGVFYGTVSLVLLVTYPRGFKKLKNKLPAVIPALIVPLVFNMIINFDGAVSPISEAGTLYSFSPLPAMPSFTATALLYSILSAAAAVLISLSTGKLSAYDSPAKGDIIRKSRTGKVYYPVFCMLFLGLCAALTVLLPGVFSRLPIASAAVVIIVPAWQQMRWSLVPRSFKNGVFGIITFILSFAAFVFITLPLAVIAVSALSLICRAYYEKRGVKEPVKKEKEKKAKNTGGYKKKPTFKKIATWISVPAMALIFILDIANTALGVHYRAQTDIQTKTFTTVGGDRIHYLNTLNSDCILIESNSHFALVDSGEGDHNPRKKVKYEGNENKVLAYLKKAAGDENGKVHLDFILGTHCHYDHIGAFAAILSDEDITVDVAYFKDYYINKRTANAYEVSLWKNDVTYDEIISLLARRNIPLVDVPPTEPFAFGDFTLQFYNCVTPLEFVSRSENAASIGIKVTKGEKNAFLASDITYTTGLEQLLKGEIGKVNVLKIGHHGYFGSSSMSFLKNVQPDYAIVTNYLGKIYPNVKWNLTMYAHVPILSTVDLNGIITTFTDDGKILFTDHIQG